MDWRTNPAWRRLVTLYGRFCQGLPLTLILASIPSYTWLWGDIEARRRMQKRGITVVPSDFYSNTPTLADIEGSFEYQGGSAPYELGADETLMQAELRALLLYAGEFSPPEAEAGAEDAGRFTWSNSQFKGADAMAYYGYLRKLRPATVLEIGSGFSSLVACAALKANGRGRLLCVEPYPRPFLRKCTDLELISKRAQELTAEFLNDSLADGDVLFVDSTHTVKSGSDCLHIYLRLLPKVRRDIHVQVHDIHLPFAIPQKAMLEKQVHWTEQYLLLAFLLDNPKARILFGTRYNNWRHGALMRELMGGKAEPSGGSFWFEYRGRTGAARA